MTNLLRTYQDDMEATRCRIGELQSLFQAIRYCGNDYTLANELAGIGAYLADDWMATMDHQMARITEDGEAEQTPPNNTQSPEQIQVTPEERPLKEQRFLASVRNLTSAQQSELIREMLKMINKNNKSS